MAAVLIAAWGWLRPAPDNPVTALFLDFGGLTVRQGTPILVSPDGRTFAAIADTSETGAPGRLFVRRIDEERFRLLVDEVVRFAAFSPDGQWLAYAAEGGLKRVSIGGGQPNTLLQIDGFRASELSWGDDGYLYFFGGASASEAGAYRIAETGQGGQPELVVAGDWIYFPTPLPGGRGILMADDRDGFSLALYDFETDSVRALIPEAGTGRYVKTGHIVFGHPDGGLQAVGFDLKRLEVSGNRVPVRDGVSLRGPQTLFSLSEAGTLAYVSGGATRNNNETQLVEYDLATGSTTDVRLPPEAYADIEVSPDGRWLAMSKRDDGSGSGAQIYVYDLELGTSPKQLTFDGSNFDPTWSPDGTRLAWVKESGDSTGVWVIGVETNAPATRISPLSPERYDLEWRTESRIVHEVQAGETRDIGVLDPSGGAPSTYLTSVFDLEDPTVSPDGSLIAYLSGELGDDEIFVRTFPDPGQPSRISVGGGFQPRWSPDGRSIYFWKRGPAGPALMRAHIRTRPVVSVDSTGTVIAGSAAYSTTYEVHPDGNRLILLRRGDSPADAQAAEAEPVRYVVVLNWFEALKERLGGR